MNENEATLKHLIVKIIDYKNELRMRITLLISVIIISIFSGYIYSEFQEEEYIATITFIVEENSEGTSISSFSGVASQFGFDLGSNATSSFSQQNVIELFKSRNIIESTLNKVVVISGKEASLLSHYINLSNLIEDSTLLDFNEMYEDSIINEIWQEILDYKLDIKYQNDDANIINLNFQFNNSLFAIYFVENIINEMSDMYSNYKTEKTRISLDNLQNRSDSIFKELQNSEYNLATVKDRNARVVNASGRLDEIKYMREVQVLNTMYLEIVKNTELVKMSLLDETPIIQIIDSPTLPLIGINRSTVFWCSTFSLLGFFLCTFIIILRKLVIDSLEEES